MGRKRTKEPETMETPIQERVEEALSREVSELRTWADRVQYLSEDLERKALAGEGLDISTMEARVLQMDLGNAEDLMRAAGAILQAAQRHMVRVKGIMRGQGLTNGQQEPPTDPSLRPAEGSGW